jgi:denticleless
MILTITEKIQPHNSPIFDLDWHNQSKRLVTGSGDLTCAVVDIETGNTLFRGLEHQNSVRAVRSCRFNDNLFLSGGRDGKILLWDTRSINEMRAIQDAEALLCPKTVHQGAAELESVTGVSFYNDETTIVSIQSNQSNIKVWDLRMLGKTQQKPAKKLGATKSAAPSSELLMMQFDKNLCYQSKLIQLKEEILINQKQPTKDKINYLWSLKEKFQSLAAVVAENSKISNNAKGYTSILVDPSQRRLLASSIDNSIQLFDLTAITTAPPKNYYGHQSTLFVRSALSPCGKFIISGSKDKKIYFWEAEGDGMPFCSLYSSLHQEEINAVDWGRCDKNFIASVSDDATLLLWDTSQ